MADAQASLLDQVRSGANRQLQMLAASGVLPLPPEELIPLQVQFASGADLELAGKAQEALRQVDARIAAPFLERQAEERVLAFFAAHVSNPRLLETILRRRDVPRRLLVEMARRLPPDLQEILVLRQDAIIEEPAILEALESNPQLSLYVQRRIVEYRDHLLPRERTPFRPEPGALGPVQEADDATAASDIAAAAAFPPVGELDEKTGLSEGQIRMLSVPTRLKLARGAPRNLRNILLRDTNPQVACSALLFNSLSDQEVESTAGNRSVQEEVLMAISKKREWASRYQVVKALVHNPRTPLATSVKFVARLSVRDLRDLARDRNVPDAVRSTALRLYRIKQK